jgi:intracellular sulfur oxidation DsrE/DsrF family protein
VSGSFGNTQLIILMHPSQQKPTRKNFLLLGIAAFCSATALRFFTRGKKKTPETVKMLTQDGRLVEIDKTLLALRTKKISNEELKQWVKNKPVKTKNISNEL